MACRRGGPAGGLAAAGEGGRAGSHQRYRLREQQSHEMVLVRRALIYGLAALSFFVKEIKIRQLRRPARRRLLPVLYH